MNKCWNCKNKKEVPGNCHIRCRKPDPEMTGDSYGISKGWFIYPYLFDPVWATKECTNYEPVMMLDEDGDRSIFDDVDA